MNRALLLLSVALAFGCATAVAPPFLPPRAPSSRPRACARPRAVSAPAYSRAASIRRVISRFFDHWFVMS